MVRANVDGLVIFFVSPLRLLYTKLALRVVAAWMDGRSNPNVLHQYVYRQILRLAISVETFMLMFVLFTKFQLYLTLDSRSLHEPS